MRKTLVSLATALLWLSLSSFTTIHLMGDSTMAEKDLKGGTNPERGWGMMFQNFMDPDRVQVINYAQNGRSTKSFIDLGLWDKVYGVVRPGDYVFIQFGHNDAKKEDPARYAAPWGAYQDNLRMFVDRVREKGGIPVLLTPVARRWFKGGVLDRNCHNEYPAAMKAVAAEKDVALLDITTATLDWLESEGDEASKAYFMISTGKDDNTHTVACGARRVTEIVCDRIREQLPALAEMAESYEKKGCRIIGLCLDAEDEETMAEARQILKEAGVSYLNIVPFEGRSELLPNKLYPTTYFVDENGTILDGTVYGAQLSKYPLVLEKLLSQPVPESDGDGKGAA